MCYFLFVVLLFVVVVFVFVDICESSFQKKGNLFFGIIYIVLVIVFDLIVKSVIGQMNVIVKGNNMDVLSVDVENGVMLIEDLQLVMYKIILIIISVISEGCIGMVVMMVKFNLGVFVKVDVICVEMCKMLIQVKFGKVGEQFVVFILKVLMVNIFVFDFGFQLCIQYKDNLVVIELCYQGKIYLIIGCVNGVFKSGGIYNIGFDIFSSILGIDFESVVIICVFVLSQVVFVLVFCLWEKVMLVGVVDCYDQIGCVLWLKDCKGN